MKELRIFVQDSIRVCADLISRAKQTIAALLRKVWDFVMSYWKPSIVEDPVQELSRPPTEDVAPSKTKKPVKR